MSRRGPTPAMRTGQIAEALREIWASYPDSPSEEQMLERLLPHRHTLTRAHGFSFQEEGETDEEGWKSKADRMTAGRCAYRFTAPTGNAG